MICNLKYLDHRIKKILKRSDRYFFELDADIDRKITSILKRIDEL